MNNELELIKEKINFLEGQLVILKNRVAKYEEINKKCMLENTIFNSKKVKCSNCDSTEIKNIEFDYSMPEKYFDYFENVLGKDKRTAERHLTQLSAWKKHLNEKLCANVAIDLFYYSNSEQFKQLIKMFEARGDMLDLNANKHHHYYSAAYNHYYNFLLWYNKNKQHKCLNKNNFEIDLEQYFYKYLKKKGYTENTTVCYVNWAKKVMERERIYSWDKLGDKIGVLCVRYEVGGEEEFYGNKGKRSVINALKRYKEFYTQLFEQLEGYMKTLK